MPRRERHLIDRLLERDLLERAADDALRRVKDRGAWYVRRFMRRREECLDEIQSMIILGEYPSKTYRHVTMVSAGKEREITPLPFHPWSVLFHAVKLLISPVIDRALIHDSSAGRAGKGQVFAALRARMFTRRYRGLTHVVAADMRKFYQSIPHALVLESLGRVIDDGLFLRLIEETVLDYESGVEPLLEAEHERKLLHCRWADRSPFRRVTGRGITIGNPISQDLGNLCLSGLDRLAKERLGVKAYHRHCDDIMLLAASKEEGERLLGALDAEARRLGLCLKASGFVAPLRDDGRGVKGRALDFAGYVMWRDNMRMRQRVKGNFARKLGRVTSRRRRRELLAAYWGIAKWGRCANLWRTITERNNIMSFADVGIRTDIVLAGKEGRRMFDVPTVKIADLAESGAEIEIEDFEPGITVQGKGGRCSVLYVDPASGERRKFITSSARITGKLARARQLEAEGVSVFPQRTVVREVRMSRGQYTYDVD